MASQDSVYTHVCKVAAAGYEIRDAEVVNMDLGLNVRFIARCLCEKQAEPEMSEKLEVQPMRVLSLFRKFAAIKSDQSIVEFASKYGFLGLGGLAERRVESALIHRVETVESWYSEASVMKTCVSLWDAADKPDIDRLSALIKPNRYSVQGRWSNKKRIAEEDHRQTSNMSFRIGDEVVMYIDAPDHSKNGVLIKLAQKYVADKINHRLYSHTSSVIFWEQDGFALEHRPSDLLGVMWLQFARQTVGQRVRKVCENCGRPFWIVFQSLLGGFPAACGVE